MNPWIPPAIQFAAALLLSPLAFGVINRTKAIFAGRRGQPLLQAYYDIAKLLGKGAVYSTTASWILRAGPMVGLACAVTALALLPWTGSPALLSFQGDLILLAYLFGLMRFFTIIAALDTGSAFEGMGASREAWFSALSEPALLLGLAALARTEASLSLSELLSRGIREAAGLPAVLLAAAAVFVVFLCENSRIPIDDPDTHLELTMIHEVMVLDHGGVDFAFIQYGSAVKLWVFASIVVGMLVPRTGQFITDACIALGGMLVLSVVTGAVESTMARLRMIRVPQLLVAAVAMSALAFILVLVG
jgi:formate hydrogenlyase subunit 4